MVEDVFRQNRPLRVGPVASIFVIQKGRRGLVRDLSNNGATFHTFFLQNFPDRAWHWLFNIMYSHASNRLDFVSIAQQNV